MKDGQSQLHTNRECCSGRGKTFNPADWTKTMWLASGTVLKQKRAKYSFLPLTIVFLFAFVIIPIVAIPSNTFALQFSLYTITDYVVLTLVAILGSLLLLTHIHSFVTLREQNKAGAVAGAGFGGASSVFASIFGAASCPMCVAALFGFLGLGTVGFLVNYQWVIFAIAALTVVVSLYFASKKIITINQRTHE